MQPAAECPVCLVPLEYPAGLASGILRIQCRRCGTFHIDSFFADSLAAERGRATRPDIKLGICGEHGGDPASIAFCEKVGLDYVSASPFRVPIARLAAAQAALR